MKVIDRVLCSSKLNSSKGGLSYRNCVFESNQGFVKTAPEHSIFLWKLSWVTRWLDGADKLLFLSGSYDWWSSTTFGLGEYKVQATKKDRQVSPKHRACVCSNESVMRALGLIPMNKNDPIFLSPADRREGRKAYLLCCCLFPRCVGHVTAGLGFDSRNHVLENIKGSVSMSLEHSTCYGSHRWLEGVD